MCALNPQKIQRQRGVALLLMITMMVIGIAALLIGALNSSTVKLTRNQMTAQALAQAKDALLGYAASDLARPGELPCPDVNDDGKLTMNVDYIGTNCVSPIGRLPWKTLGLTELREGAGEHLWYALAKPFWANGSTPINSDTLGNLAVSGTNNVIAILFAPNVPINGQRRSATQQMPCATQGGVNMAENLCATNYLEDSNAALNLAANPNLSYQSSSTSVPFNDQLLFITPNELFPVIEKRVAIELKAILANYYATNGMYPYPANLANCQFNASSPANSHCSSDATQCRGWIPLTTPGYNNWILPAWFSNNGWYRTIHYAADSSALGTNPSGTASCNAPLNISGSTVRALFFLPGTPLTTFNQTRPSTLLANYLEDAENQNLDNNYVKPADSARDTLYSLP